MEERSAADREEGGSSSAQAAAEGSTRRVPASDEPASGPTRTSGMEGLFELPSAKLPVGTLINGRYQIEQVLGTGGMGSVYRVTDRLFPERPTALKIMRSHANELGLSLFRAEFRTMAGLDHPHVAAVYDFERIVGSDELLFTMEYLRGVDLRTHVRGRPFPVLVQALREIAEALAYIHNRDFVHLDLKPSNVLVLAGDGRVKVLDFGLAGMRNLRSSLFGTLPYMAPEVLQGAEPDGRSDLYSLGVMGFELLCGRFPHPTELGTQETIEHKIQHPVRFSPSERARFPAWLCDVIERLAATAPAERFADAHAVVEALERLMTERPTMAAGAAGASRLRAAYGSTFAGRAAECGALCTFVQGRVGAAVDRPATSPSMMWIAGPSGIGKSRLMLEVRRQLQLLDIPLLSGDCYDRDIGEYTALGPILLGVATLALAAERRELITRLGPEIVKMAPGFGQALSIRPSQSLGNARAERQRIHNTAADFLLLTSVHVPFALYLNDLQWAAPGTVDFLANLIDRLGGEPAARLAILGSYRSDQAQGQPVGVLLERSAHDPRYRRQELAPLDLAAVAEIAGSMLAAQVPRSLAERLYAASQGQPLRVEETVRGWVEAEHLIVREGQAELTAAGLAADLDVEIGAAILRRAERLDEVPRHLLDALAICARPVEPAILTGALGIAPEPLHAALRALIERQLVVAVAGEPPRYNLAHDRIRETLYAALPASERDRLHRQLGHSYWRTLAASDDGERLLVTVGHLSSAVLPEAPAEREALFELTLRAARAAHAASAFAQALQYLQQAERLLGPSRWSEQRERALRWALQQAESAYALGDFDAAQQAARQVIDHARDLLIEARGWEYWVLCANVKLDHDQAIDAGVEIANRLGARIPKHPTPLHTAGELLELRWLVRGRQLDIEALVGAEETTNPAALQIMRLMLALLGPTIYFRPTLFPIMNFELARQSLRHGPGPFGANAILGAAIIFEMAGDIATSHRLTVAAERLLPRTHKDYVGKAVLGLQVFLLHWRQPAAVTAAALHAGHLAALEVGDSEYVGHLLHASWCIDLYRGRPLDELAGQFAAHRIEVDQTGEINRFRSGLLQQMVHALRDGVSAPLHFRGPFHVDTVGLPPFMAVTETASRHLVAAFYRVDVPDAALDNPHLDSLAGGMRSYVLAPSVRTHSCLVWLRAARQPRPWWTRQRLLWRVVGSLRKLRLDARRSPVNHSHRPTLVLAEWLRTRGQRIAALPLYEQAIRQADENGFPHEAALARELLAELYLELGRRGPARTLLTAAQALYSAWGATGKVRDVATRYRDLLSPSA